MDKIDFFSEKTFHELNAWAADEKLKASIEDCLLAQYRAGMKLKPYYFKPRRDALDCVSEEALRQIMQSGEKVSDIRTQRSISNCIAFNSANLEGSVMNQHLLTLRRRCDALVSAKLQGDFKQGRQIRSADSGHFWYPPQSFMGWHTNLRTPGWRLYINYCKQPGKSFFRYRDPESGAIVTSWDKEWNFRLFRVDSEKLFWHAVYSETDRFSLGYKVSLSPRNSLPVRILRKTGRVLAGALSGA